MVLESYDRLVASWGVQTEERDLETSYGKTHVILAGDAALPSLLLFHGVGDNSALMWVYNAKEISRHFRLAAIDTMGGAGRSRPDERYGKGFDLSRWYGDVLAALDIRKTYAAGVSYGCYHVQLLLASFPDRVDRIVGMAGSVAAYDRRAGKFRQLVNMMKMFIPEGLFPTRENAMKIARKMTGRNADALLGNEAIANHFWLLMKHYSMQAQMVHHRRMLDTGGNHRHEGEGPLPRRRPGPSHECFILPACHGNPRLAPSDLPRSRACPQCRNARRGERGNRRFLPLIGSCCRDPQPSALPRREPDRDAVVQQPIGLVRRNRAGDDPVARPVEGHPRGERPGQVGHRLQLRRRRPGPARARRAAMPVRTMMVSGMRSSAARTSAGMRLGQRGHRLLGLELDHPGLHVGQGPFRGCGEQVDQPVPDIAEVAKAGELAESRVALDGPGEPRDLAKVGGLLRIGDVVHDQDPHGLPVRRAVLDSRGAPSDGAEQVPFAGNPAVRAGPPLPDAGVRRLLPGVRPPR